MSGIPSPPAPSPITPPQLEDLVLHTTFIFHTWYFLTLLLTRHKTPILARRSLSIPISIAPSQYQNSHYSVGISRQADPRGQVLARSGCLRALPLVQQGASRESGRINGNAYASGHPGLTPRHTRSEFTRQQTIGKLPGKPNEPSHYSIAWNR